jgi:hypothetical protein
LTRETAGPHYLSLTSHAPFRLLVHHDDAAREFAYDRASAVGKLARGLDEAKTRQWTLVSMKDEWQQIFPFHTKWPAHA